MPSGSSRESSRDLLLDVVAERQHVAAGGHGDGKPDRRLAVVAEHRLRGIDVAALDGGDVAQAEEAVVEAKVDRLQALLGGELAGDADGDPLGAGVDRPARGQRVLRLQRGDERVRLQAERGHLLRRELEVDLLVLHADQVDLGDVRHAQQLGADTVGLVVQLAMREAVGDEGDR